MKKYISVIFMGLLATSCVDNNLLPDDKTVEEDFWKTKSDVSLMVSGAYKSMISEDVISRCVVWGDFRSDELNTTSAINISDATSTDLKEINAAGTQPDNSFADWSDFYKIINNCNVVLKHAQGVMAIDPSYTEGDYDVDRSQMLALRALAYFYLVRAFRDIPYSAEAFQNSSQDLQLPQAAPDSVLQCCINDLEEAEKKPLYPDGYKDWRKVGLFTLDGIDALMADIYLWRASMTHNATYYSKCVEYCDKVIASKKLQNPPSELETEHSEYPLEDGESAFNEIFINGNSKESILEFQMDGKVNSNTSVCKDYYMYASTGKYGYMQASKIFGNYDTSNNAISGDNVYHSGMDYRFWDNCFGVTKTSSDEFPVRKMVDNMPSGNSASNRVAVSLTSRPYSNYSQNWIVYRITDVMLMKAEALVQLAADDNDTLLSKAYSLVKVVNNRSMAALGDSIKFKNYNTRENMEKLVLAERQRELCFEGKRWFDLLRYNYRHVDGVDATTTLASQAARGISFIKNNDSFLNFIQRKYTEGGSSVIYKMATEPTLYYPILESELKVNANLKQNPAYTTNGEYIKNY